MSQRGPVRSRLPRLSGLPRAGVVVAGLAVLAVIGVLAAVPGPPQLTATWTGWLNGGLEAYADTAGQWNSGDDAAVVALPGGRSLWLLGDSYDGPVNADGTVNPFRAHYVPNLLLLTHGAGSSFGVDATVTGRVSRGVPSSAVQPVHGSPRGSWAWPAGGVVAGNAVSAVYDVFAPVTSGASSSGASSSEVSSSGSSYVPAGTEIVRMPLSSLTRPSTYSAVAGPSADCRIGGADCVQWGVSLLDSTACPPATGLARCTYIYGEQWPGAAGSSTSSSSPRRLVEAVAGQGSLGVKGGWWYDTTSGWTRSASHLAYPLGGTTVTGISVYRVSNGSYVALSGGAAGVMAYYANTPSLENASAAELFEAPDASGALRGMPGAAAYQFRIEPAYSRGPKVVLGFSVNTADHDQACMNYAPYYDVTAYQPEFYSFTLPPSAGSVATGSLPAPRPRTFAGTPVAGERWGTSACSRFTNVPVPAGFRARYSGGGRVALSWSDPGGLYQYDVRTSDAGDPGAGWREFGYPVWDGACPGRAGSGNCVTDTADASLLAPGHTYRYQISAWNWAGGSDGGFSRAQASVTVPAEITAVTSGLCATPAGGGLVLGSCSGRADGQEWRYTPVARSGKVTEYAVASLDGGRCLVPARSGLGAPVATGPCKGAAREWEFRITDGVYDFNLVNKSTGLCLAVSGNSQFPGARLVQSACGGGPGAIWHSSFA